jgi:ribosomal protein S18 acetylase RimI-like enzyme
MDIKQATLSEVDALAPIFHEYRQISISCEDRDQIEDSKKWLYERISNREAVVFIAVDDGQVVGFGNLYKGFSSISLKKYWILNDLYVAPEYRGKGYAKSLISKIHQHALTSGAKGIELETAHSNTSAQALYESVGYLANQLYKRYFWSSEQQST